MAKHLILCDCLGSQSLDGAAIDASSGLSCGRVHTSLCEDQIDLAAKAIAGGDVIIACQQERARFEALAEEIGAPMPGFVDLRDRAGWSDEGARSAPKMAALAAEAALQMPGIKALDVVSEGMCLILGPAAIAIPAAEQLCGMLSVTVLLSDDAEPPEDRRFDVVRGTLRAARGSLGNFDLSMDDLQERVAGGRGAARFKPAVDDASSHCDILLDLRGGTPLFPAHDKRAGYLRPDPKDPRAVARAVMDASHMVGTFEQPLHVQLTATLCAHSRAGQVGCSNCLDICPTGAILPDGDHVAIDPMICAGCGACSAVCPSGAISYDAPPVETVFRRLSTLAGAYRKAGGTAPRLLVHDSDHGGEMIRLAARHGRGLPADVIPMEVAALAGFGHAEMLAALACGFGAVDLMLAPRTERAAPERELALAQALAPDLSLRLIEPVDPDALEGLLYAQPQVQGLAEPVLPMGSRRQIARLSAKALNPGAAVIDLPRGAPYGAIRVDTEACTMCLSCVSLCPSGALGDNPDLPQLRFQEDACLQCGLCATICPETAITLQPQFDLTDAAFTQKVLNEEEPFACIECGSLFGVKSTVEKITGKLANTHHMFKNPETIRMIQMCDNCRVNAQYHAEDSPLKGADRPRPRTTDDYFSKRKDH